MKSHAPAAVALCSNGEMARFANTESDTPRQTIGQNPPASVSQTVPVHLKYWPKLTPTMHGMIPKTVAETSAFCRGDQLSILFPSEEMRREARTESRCRTVPGNG